MMYADQSTEGICDQAFIDMMRDFMKSHHDSNASTESFKAIVEKHMTKKMDLQQNGGLDWFFDEWVYGTQVPRYPFKYDVQPGDKGSRKVASKSRKAKWTSTSRCSCRCSPILGQAGSAWASWPWQEIPLWRQSLTWIGSAKKSRSMFTRTFSNAEAPL
jgi:hypothetical protein